MIEERLRKFCTIRGYCRDNADFADVAKDLFNELRFFHEPVEERSLPKTNILDGSIELIRAAVSVVNGDVTSESPVFQAAANYLTEMFEGMKRKEPAEEAHENDVAYGAVLKEREVCAKVAEDPEAIRWAGGSTGDARGTAANIARLIRARSTEEPLRPGFKRGDNVKIVGGPDAGKVGRVADINLPFMSVEFDAFGVAKGQYRVEDVRRCEP
jgi:transcription antitermination factor NusG